MLGPTSPWVVGMECLLMSAPHCHPTLLPSIHSRAPIRRRGPSVLPVPFLRKIQAHGGLCSGRLGRRWGPGSSVFYLSAEAPLWTPFSKSPAPPSSTEIYSPAEE
ncbi:unnamed protein product [Arctogadus glacialis]